jgi:hypothetical protein
MERDFFERDFKVPTRRRMEGCLGCFNIAVSFAALTTIIGLTLANAGVGIGISAKVPFTDSNFTIVSSFGHKDKVIDTLPTYTKNKIGGNENFVNSTGAITVGPAEQVGQLIIGKQKGAPSIIGVHIDFNH